MLKLICLAILIFAIYRMRTLGKEAREFRREDFEIRSGRGASRTETFEESERQVSKRTNVDIFFTGWVMIGMIAFIVLFLSFVL